MTAQATNTLRLAIPVLEDYVHLSKRMRADELDQFMAMSDMGEFRSDACARALANTAGPQWVALDPDNRPVLLGGFQPLRPGVYEGWQISTDEAWARWWRSFTKISVRLMDDMFAGGAHRIQTCALHNRTITHAWYERIGMRREGVLTRYCADGQDAIMFARTAK